ncbi:GTP cyclohydrolase IIa [Halonotius terrestris]|uniref:GTP cyclohydrolase III n=1 Tax=Halonotius terrestris TaxID=2487750 RepID=A0A8J8PB77_9EURY|nr:GTP cyclohydrolase III [Halonotius terrestris]TQQ80035.1 GTP cyclohydrolase IIa [Halonotius terrestris]
MTTQLTLIQIDNYGPWTVTPEPRREMDLQTMQSRLFADIAQFLGSRGGYVFFSRFDNMIAVTNGIGRAGHTALQETIRNRYPVTVSLGIGTADTPAVALDEATEKIQAAGSAQDEGRTEVLAGDPLDSDDDSTVHIAHFDVNDATGKYTDQLNEFDSFIHIERSYASLMEYMREAHGALSFFVGGDNIISVCPSLSPDDYQAAIDHVESDAGVALKVGVGRGETAHDAGYAAKHALEDCRYEGTSVEFDQPPATTGDD